MRRAATRVRIAPYPDRAVIHLLGALDHLAGVGALAAFGGLRFADPPYVSGASSRVDTVLAVNTSLHWVEPMGEAKGVTYAVARSVTSHSAQSPSAAARVKVVRPRCAAGAPP